MRPLFLLAGLCGSVASAQWIPSRVPGVAEGFTDVTASVTGDSVFAVGLVAYGSDYWQDNNPVFMYTQGQWTAYPDLNGMVYSTVVYHDTLLAGGDFDRVEDTIPSNGIAYLSEAGWRPYGTFPGIASVQKLRVIDDTLYAAGVFERPGPNQAVMRRDGGQWVGVGTWEQNSPYAADLIKYHGALVAVGNLFFGECGRVAYLEGDQWHCLGNGILGGLSSARCMAVYHDDLYLGGSISVGEGNPGQEIIRWNGHEYLAVGQGVQYVQNGFDGFCTVSDMVVHNDVLYVCGGFRYASGIPARGVAAWNGAEWCAPEGDIRTGFGGAPYLDFYRDTLFVACGDTANGVFVNCLAKFGGTTYQNVCTSTLDVSDAGAAQAGMRLAPVPATDVLRVWLPRGAHILQLFDAMGRLCLQRTVNSNGEAAVELDVSGCAEGGYLLRASDLPPQRAVVMH